MVSSWWGNIQNLSASLSLLLQQCFINTQLYRNAPPIAERQRKLIPFVERYKFDIQGNSEIECVMRQTEEQMIVVVGLEVLFLFGIFPLDHLDPDSHCSRMMRSRHVSKF
ncbi:hypothetical protein ILYODFUR_020189 [Ilyodon furcidens]|uniref:Uncharacterized protein n=1 Tax=Ilyodon furcidens TaxID=33524 RepID=A0ABV0T2D7_9TELE